MQLLVVGGSGFLGRKICREAVKQGWGVTSVSRGGRPQSLHSPFAEAWSNKVHWLRGDALDRQKFQEACKPVLKECNAVVYCLGTLFDNTSYKKLISCATQATTSSPSSPTTGGYEKLNYQGAMNVSAALIDSSSSGATSGPLKRFVYLSSELPLAEALLPEYATSKSKAERDLAAIPLLETTIFRPGGHSVRCSYFSSSH